MFFSLLFLICTSVHAAVLENKDKTSSVYDSIKVILFIEYARNDDRVDCVLEKFQEINIENEIDPKIINDYENLSKHIKPLMDEFKKSCEVKKPDKRNWFQILFSYSPTSVVSAATG
jgi:hypothetical protein